MQQAFGVAAGAINIDAWRVVISYLAEGLHPVRKTSPPVLSLSLCPASFCYYLIYWICIYPFPGMKPPDLTRAATESNAFLCV